MASLPNRPRAAPRCRHWPVVASGLHPTTQTCWAGPPAWSSCPARRGCAAAGWAADGHCRPARIRWHVPAAGAASGALGGACWKGSWACARPLPIRSGDKGADRGGQYRWCRPAGRRFHRAASHEIWSESPIALCCLGWWRERHATNWSPWRWVMGAGCPIKPLWSTFPHPEV